MRWLHSASIAGSYGRTRSSDCNAAHVEERKLCVVCGSIYRAELRTCPEDGSMLVIEAEQGEQLRLGHVLGNYRLIRKLGEGGVGAVY